MKRAVKRGVDVGWTWGATGADVGGKAGGEVAVFWGGGFWGAVEKMVRVRVRVG